MNDLGCDFIYSGANPIPFMLPNGMKEIQNYAVWKSVGDQLNKFPLFQIHEYQDAAEVHQELNFLAVPTAAIDQAITLVGTRKDTVLLLSSSNAHGMHDLRRAFVALLEANCTAPVVVQVSYPDHTADQTMLYAATDVGGLLVHGFGGGIVISLNPETSQDRKQVLEQIKLHNSVSFGVLQAARTRMSKT